MVLDLDELERRSNEAMKKLGNNDEFWENAKNKAKIQESINQANKGEVFEYSFMEKELFTCSCSSNEHIIIFTYDKEDELVYMSVHLSDKGFWSRLKSGIKYIFGYRSRFGDFEEVLIDCRNYNQFKNIIDFFEKQQ